MSIRGAKSPATIRAYKSDFKLFFPPEQSRSSPRFPNHRSPPYLGLRLHTRSLAAAKINRRLTSITKVHQAAGWKGSPASSRHFVVGEPLKRIRHAIGTAQHCKAPLLTPERLHKNSADWVLKVAARPAGTKTALLGAHNLRAGHCTQAAMNGVNERDILRQAGQKSPAMLARYIRIGKMYTRNTAAGLGI